MRTEDESEECDKAPAKAVTVTVDQDAFTALMQDQRQRARKAREALGDLGWSGVDLGQEMPETKFVGYTEYVSRRCFAQIKRRFESK